MVVNLVAQKQVGYAYVGEGRKENKTSKKLKKIFTPDKKITSAFVLIFIVVIIVAAMNFPIGAFMSGNMEATINVGIPLTFLEFKLSGSGSSFFIENFIIDLLLYSLLAYILNVALNFLTSISLFKKKAVAEEQPTVFKDQKVTATEKLVEKVAEKI